jgi:16S rRNA (cytosine967-C5)-methyltransferase
MPGGGRLHESLRDAAKAVGAVAHGQSLSAVIDRERAADAGMDSARPALVDLTHGTLRAYGRMQALTRALSRKGSAADPLVEALLWCAFYALDSGRYAPHTVVDQAVRACNGLERHPAKGYVNGILRNYLREKEALGSRLQDQPEFRWLHPSWWIELVRRAWPGQWEGVLASGNAKGPMTLRVNRRRGDQAAYLERLSGEGIAASATGSDGVTLERAMPVARLPGFVEGDVTVQDAGAQLAAPYLDAKTGMRVLDACAAPGGKASHILELADAELTALDVDAQRCTAIERNLGRLQLTAEVRQADCVALAAWWDRKPFDRILADVPCTGSGVVRRHPDIKWLRRASDVPAFAARQSAILDALWQVLAPDGKLLYVTCSVFPEENNAVVDAFCMRTPGARRLALPGGAAGQLLPGPGNDGFFYALLGRGA